MLVVKRFLATGPFIDVPDVDDDMLVVVPNSAAARRLGRRPTGLGHLAKGILASENIGIASGIDALKALKTAITKILPERDTAAEAKRYQRIVGVVLRDSISLAALKASGLRSAHDLALIVDEYRTILWQRHLVASEDALGKAAELIRERKKLLVYGFFRARHPDIEFIDKLAGEGSIFVLPSGDEKIFTSSNNSLKWLIEHGWEPKDFGGVEQTKKGISVAKRFAAESGAVDTDAIRAFGYADIDAEIRATLAAAKKLVRAGVDSSRLAIVSRKAPDYEGPLRTIAREYGLAIESDTHTPLLNTRIGAFVSLIFEAVENGFEFSLTARYLQHPYGPQIDYDAWATARRRRASGTEAWLESGIDLSALDTNGERTIAGWISWLHDVTPLTGVRSGSKTSAAELIAYDNFSEALAQLGESSSDENISFTVFAETIRDLLETASTPVEPSRGGIRFLQPDTIIGGEFDHVFVVGMAEGLLPAITNEDTIVDFHEQAELEPHGVHFDPPVEFPRWEALSFYYVLLASRGSVTLSYPRAIGIEEKLPSPFFERLGLNVEKGVVAAVSSPDEALVYSVRDRENENLRVGKVSIDLPNGESISNNVPDNAQVSAVRRQYAIEKRRESAESYDEYDGRIAVEVSAANRIWSASQFTKLGQCAFQWFAQKALRLTAPDEADPDMRPTTVGGLYHKTLQLAAENAAKIAKDAADFREAVIRQLESAFLEAEADPEIAVSGMPNWHLRRDEYLNTLRAAVESEDFIADGASFIAAEVEVEFEWEGFRMSAKIDRVDRTADDKYIAIDYKTGKYVARVKDENGELKTDIQLPVYSKALEKEYPGKVDEGYYFSINDTKKLKKQNTGSIDAFAATVKQILAEGNFAIEPDLSRKSCKYCDYDAVCRNGQRIARKRKT